MNFNRIGYYDCEFYIWIKDHIKFHLLGMYQNNFEEIEITIFYIISISLDLICHYRKTPCLNF